MGHEAQVEEMRLVMEVLVLLEEVGRRGGEVQGPLVEAAGQKLLR